MIFILCVYPSLNRGAIVHTYRDNVLSPVFPFSGQHHYSIVGTSNYVCVFSISVRKLCIHVCMYTIVHTHTHYEHGLPCYGKYMYVQSYFTLICIVVCVNFFGIITQLLKSCVLGWVASEMDYVYNQ